MAFEFEHLTIIPPQNIEAVDIEAKLEDLYMETFRAIYKNHPKYTYSDNKKNTKIMITSEYPTKNELPMKIPQILIHNISYSINLDNTIFRNYLDCESIDKPYIDSFTEATIIPYSLAISAISGKSTSKNIANEIVSYLSFVYKKVFDQLNLQISNLSKGPTQAISKYPQEIFETVIQISGTTQWSGNIKTIDKTKEQVLKRIDINIEM